MADEQDPYAVPPHVASTLDGQTVTGTDGKDTLSGTSAGDAIDGGQSDDTIYAGAGGDLIFGGDAGDASGGGQANAKTVESFVFDTDKITDRTTGSGPGAIGDSVTYSNIATATDGTPISVKISVTGMSNTSVDVDLGYSDGYPVFINRNGEWWQSDETVDVCVEFVDANGDPITINSNFTFRDIDDAGWYGTESVEIDKADITGYAVSDGYYGSNITADDQGGSIDFGSTTAGSLNDENLWLKVFFEGQSQLDFSLRAREGAAGYGFDTVDFDGDNVFTEVDASGDDLIYAGAGNDAAFGGGGEDTLYGEADDDYLDGGEDKDTLFGGDGHDTLLALSGNDKLYGGTGDDILVIGDNTGNAKIDGGTGIDIFDASGLSIGITISKDGEEADFGSSSVDVDNVESYVGTDFADDMDFGKHDGVTVDAGAGNDTVEGSEGNDILSGGSGADTLKGEDGDDTLEGGAGADSLYGGKGDDRLTFNMDSGGDSIAGGEDQDTLDSTQVGANILFASDGTATISSGGVSASFTEIEIFDLGNSNDSFDASAAAWSVTVDGGAGADRLTGSSVADTIYGGAGDDTIGGGGGADTLFGGTGADTFSIFSADFSDLGTPEEIEAALLHLNLTGIESWQGAKGYQGPETSGNTGDPNDLNVNVIGNDVKNVLKFVIGTKAAKDAEKLVEDALDKHLEDNPGEPVSALELSGIAYNVLEPELGGILAATGSTTVFFSAHSQLGTDAANDGSEPETVMEADILDRASHVVIEDFELGTDTFDLSEHDYLGGSALSTNDVKITDTAGDGTGDAVLTLPDGSTITLKGVGVGDLDPETLESMGFAASDDSTGSQNAFLTEHGKIGTGGGNDIVSGSARAETIFGGAGSDTIQLGGGADTVVGGDDQDVFILSDDFGGVSIDGGAGGVDGDEIDASGLSQGITVTADGSGGGTFSLNTAASSAPPAMMSFVGSAPPPPMTSYSAPPAATGQFENVEEFTGTTSADSYDFTADSDGTGVSVAAGDGNDSIQGSQNADILLGEGDDDTIRGRQGDDFVDGGAGNDSLDGDNGNDTIYGAGGDDTIDAGGNTNTVYGGSGDDNVLASTGNTTTYGGDDSDSIGIGFGTDVIYGGEAGIDSDTLTGAVANDALSVTLTGNESGTFDDLTDSDGGSFNGIEAFELTSGNDSFDGSGATTSGATVYGGGGTDSVIGTGGDDLFYAGDNDDSAYGGDGNDIIYGGLGNDTLGTGAGEDTLFGGQGNDVLTNSTGDDILYGGTGDDSLVASLGNDTLYGGADNDQLYGGEDNDVLYGGTGQDTLYGGAGADTQYGGDDQDIFVIQDGFGADVIYGGEGGIDLDTLDLSALGAGVSVTYTNDERGTFTDGTDTASFYGIENVVLTDQADVVDATSTFLGVTIDARGGDDSIAATGALNEIYGGTGSDTIETGFGFDTVYGGAGADSIYGGDNDDRLFGGDDADTINAGLGDDTVYGGLGMDSIYGGSNNDLLYGGDGDDSVDGGVGTDTIFGGDGNDLVKGGGNTGNSDLVYGGSGNDTVIGGDGAGSDTLYGGTGNDTLSGQRGADTIFAGDGQDTILIETLFGADVDLWRRGRGRSRHARFLRSGLWHHGHLHGQ